MENKIPNFIFESTRPNDGPRILVLGGIHGDEPCGPTAIERMVKKFQEGKITLQRGSMHFVPRANPQACEAGVRVLNEDLNREFRKTGSPTTYERTLANELTTFVDEADVMLDIHSSRAAAPTNIFIDYPTPENSAFANALHAEYAVFDWPKVYEDSDKAFDSYTSDWYAHSVGKIGLLMECGQHQDPEAVTVAEDTIMRTMAHFKLIPPLEDTPQPSRHSVSMKKLYAKEAEGDKFLGEWCHLQRIAAGTCIAERASGEQICVGQDSYIIFPKSYAKPGGEWFYVGVAI